MAPGLRPPSPGVGLCETCANVRVVETRKGSRFYLCMLSETDPRFPKYPRLPVHRCHGYHPAGDAEIAATTAAEEGGG
jgi:hypothetical protein